MEDAWKLMQYISGLHVEITEDDNKLVQKVLTIL